MDAQSNKQLKAGNIKIGLVGLGLMGSSIAISFLLSGYQVVAIAPIEGEIAKALPYLEKMLIEHLRDENSEKKTSHYLDKLTLSESYQKLADCGLVLECVIEKIDIKKQIYDKVESVISNKAVLATNTSAIPISYLQQFVRNPKRFLGIHWAEPAYNTRFLEIICGSQTDIGLAQWVYNQAHYWHKEPTLLKKDIRGFITNRLMYASFRESLFIVGKGTADKEDVDKCFRYDFGSWMTLMGVFRRIDYIGLEDFAKVLKETLKSLNNDSGIPPIMQKMVDENAKGIHNRRGLYCYSEESSKTWKESFIRFTKEIAVLANQYPADVVQNKLKGKK